MFDLAKEAREQVAAASFDWRLLDGRSVLITGATGLIGSACVRMLLERNRLSAGNPIITWCLVRDEAKARQVFSGYGPDDGLRFIEATVEDVVWPEHQPLHYIIHAACPTASRYFVEHPVETADAIVLGTRNLLGIARKCGALGFVYVSSMEAYGDGNEAPGLDHLLGESEVGYVNPLSTRSCYSEGKRMAEQYCCDFASEYSVPAMVVRLAQTFGPGIPKDDSRLFAMCARNALSGCDIVLKTTGESTRMYLYTADAVSALFTVLLKGAPGEAYNAANPSTYSSVREMAEMVAGLLPGHTVSVRCELDLSAPYPPQHHLPLDVSRLLALGWRPRLGLPEMYRNLIDYLRD